jgi:hypothetical protein
MPSEKAVPVPSETHCHTHTHTQNTDKLAECIDREKPLVNVVSREANIYSSSLEKPLFVRQFQNIFTIFPQYLLGRSDRGDTWTGVNLNSHG